MMMMTDKGNWKVPVKRKKESDLSLRKYPCQTDCSHGFPLSSLSTDSWAWVQQHQVWHQIGQVSPHSLVVTRYGTKDEDTCDVSVIKKGSTYSQIGTRWFKFLDISNSLARRMSFSPFLKAYKNQGSQIILPMWTVWPQSPSCWTFQVCHFMVLSTLYWS